MRKYLSRQFFKIQHKFLRIQETNLQSNELFTEKIQVFYLKWKNISLSCSAVSIKPKLSLSVAINPCCFVTGALVNTLTLTAVLVLLRLDSQIWNSTCKRTNKNNSKHWIRSNKWKNLVTSIHTIDIHHHFQVTG